MSKSDSWEATPCPIDASLYDIDYFLSACEGYEEFAVTGRELLSSRLAKALTYADVHPGMRVLDVGCGRGESLIWLVRQGAEIWGVDYAPAALHLSASAIRLADLGADHRYYLAAANARHLPFPPESFDRVLMLDIVEHLHPWELEQAFGEVRRVLKQNGKFIIHTAPNLWYYRFGYPLFRFFERLRGVQLPKNPRQRFRYHELMHVNEQSIWTLKRSLQQCGFRSQVWLAYLPINRQGLSGRAAQLADLVQQLPLLQWIFRNHILATATKRY
jgi:ubiquinone/menaquinone biosynthesis C-methylase UbiE